MHPEQETTPGNVLNPVAANNELLLRMIRDLRQFGTEGYGCRELSLAITRLEEAQHWLAIVPPQPAPNTK